MDVQEATLGAPARGCPGEDPVALDVAYGLHLFQLDGGSTVADNVNHRKYPLSIRKGGS